MSEFELLKSGSAILDASGSGTLVLGPERAGESWEVTRISVTCTSTLQTVVTVYENVVSTQTALFNSKAGNSDVAAGDPPMTIPSGSRVVIVWTAGTPGAAATAVLKGKLFR